MIHTMVDSGSEGLVIMNNKKYTLPVGLALVLLVSGSAVYGQNINTVAGGGPDNLAATSSSIGTPWGVVEDGAGNTYISDPFSNRVFRVDASTKKLTVLAGNIVNGFLLDGGPAAAASLSAPEGIAVDTTGNVYIADSGNNVIRIVNTQSNAITIAGLSIPAGAIATLAGNGSTCTVAPCGDGGPALSASLTGPAGVFLDGTNNIYIADTGDHVIRKVMVSTGTISLVAGTYLTSCVLPAGVPCGDGTAATSALLSSPNGVTLDANGNVYIADTSDFTIRVVNTQGAPIVIQGVTIPAGDIATVAGNFQSCPSNPIPQCGDTGAATSAELNFPRAVFVDSSLDIFLADTQAEVVREVSSGTILSIAGTYVAGFSGDGGFALNAALNTPSGVFVDGAGNTFIADTTNDVVREVTQADGKINTTIGFVVVVQTVPTPQEAFSGDGAAATDASLQEPTAIVADAASNWYIADAANNRIRVVNNQTKTITIAGVSIPPGAIATVAGDGNFCNTLPCGDNGPPLQAQLAVPTGVALDAKGNIYIVDSEDSVIRVVNTQSSAISVAGTTVLPGTILTVVGNGLQGYVDDVAASFSRLAFPIGMTLDSAGNLYIADGNPLGGPTNNVIRVVNTQAAQITVAGVTIPSGFIRTVAGTPQTACAAPTGSCGDGGAATQAFLTTPTSVALDHSGNIYIADFGDNKIRKVVSSGTISTVAGTGGQCLSSSCGDNGPAKNALLFTPFDIAVDFLGDVFIADSGDFVIRAVNPGSSSVTLGGVTIAAGDIAPVVGIGARGFFGDGGPALSAGMAEPLGLGTDAAGDLLITDGLAWRVRDVKALLATTPVVNASPSSLTFPAQAVGTASAGQDVTLTNTANVSPLAISKISTTGDFLETDNCGSSVPAGGSCKITVTFTPTVTGARAGTLTITDAVGTQTVQLTGTATAAPDFTVTSTGANPTSVKAGASSTATLTFAPASGFTGTTTLTCSVSPSPALAPGCSLNPASLVLSGGSSKTSTLTITTTAASAALTAPDIGRRSTKFYAIWLLLPAMFLSTAGLTAPARKKLIALCLLSIAVAGVLFLVACGGGGSGSSGGGTGGSGTPAGSYTITVTSKSGSVTHQTPVTLTVQ